MSKKIIIAACVTVLGLWTIPKLVRVQIEPWEIGVRQSLTGGVEGKDFDFGYHWRLPLIHRFYRLPRTVHYLDYNNDDPQAEASSLEVRTKENNIIFVDLTIPWCIRQGEAWKIIREGNLDSYSEKVESTAAGVLREGLADLSSIDVQLTDRRIETAAQLLPRLNEALAQYHVVAHHIVVRAIRFRSEYEAKLQGKQLFRVKGKLDEALRKQSLAIQETETVEKGIERETNIKREEWNEKIEKIRTEYEVEIAKIAAESVRYDRRRRSQADAAYSRMKAEGDLAEANAEALGRRLESTALSSRAGRVYSAVIAAENFKIGDVALNSNDPMFLNRFGSMRAWHDFFLGH